MTEELRKEATTTVQWECTPMIDRPTFINGYITGAEPREKRVAELEEKLANADYQLEGRDNEIAELKAENELIKKSDTLCKLIGEQKLQIEKMKCVQNCKYGGCDNNCHYENEVFVLPKCTYCNNWQLKESAE